MYLHLPPPSSYPPTPNNRQQYIQYNNPIPATGQRREEKIGGFCRVRNSHFLSAPTPTPLTALEKSRRNKTPVRRRREEGVVE